MAIQSRKNAEEMLQALIFAHNQMQSNVVTAGFHRDLTQTTNGPLSHQSSITLTAVTVSAANASDLPTTLTLANQLLGTLRLHFNDAQVHLKSDLTNYLTLAALQDATSLVTVQTNLNAIKTTFTAHLSQSGVHSNNDGTAYGLPANATDLTTSQALATALKAAVNTHMANAGSNFNCCRIQLIDN